jgi:hypothetical protein
MLETRLGTGDAGAQVAEGLTALCDHTPMQEVVHKHCAGAPRRDSRGALPAGRAKASKQPLSSCRGGGVVAAEAPKVPLPSSAVRAVQNETAGEAADVARVKALPTRKQEDPSGVILRDPSYCTSCRGAGRAWVPLPGLGTPLRDRRVPLTRLPGRITIRSGRGWRRLPKATPPSRCPTGVTPRRGPNPSPSGGGPYSLRHVSTPPQWRPNAPCHGHRLPEDHPG